MMKMQTLQYITLKIICSAVIISQMFGMSSWCSAPGAQILFIEEPLNASFDSFENYNSEEGFTINTVGCVFPRITVQDVSMNKCIHAPKIVIPPCEYYYRPLLGNNNTHIWIIQNNLKYFNISKGSVVNCCYRPFYKPLSAKRIYKKFMDRGIEYLDCIMFKDEIEVNNEFVAVRCFHDDDVIYSQYYVFAPKKPFTFNRENPFKKPVNQTMYNIIIMGLGSMSRHNFYRTMPYTLDMLKKYNAIELKGYNTVSQDTFPNLMAILVGMNSSELVGACFPHGRSTLDNCPFIWERFKDMGYYTALMEDTARYGVFNQGKFVFKGNPTDYYLYPFMRESEKLHRHKWKFKKAKDLVQYLLAHRARRPSTTCMGDKYYFEVLLNYVSSLTTTLKNFKLFGLFWEISMSHDDLNDPIRMDKGYETLLRKLEMAGYLNDTILIFLSDHGMDSNEIQSTKQGRIEQRLPLVFIVVPPSFRKEYRLAYHNLKVNQGRLTTPYDIHQTLIDFIDLNVIREEEILRRSRQFYTQDRGISLFLQIPRNRSCELAGIHNKWCVCYNYVRIAHDNPVLFGAISYLTYQINEVLKPYPECLKLIVDEIILAKELLPAYEGSDEWRDFSIIVRMAPGGGIYETMMRKHNRQWYIVDRVKRLNFPGFRSLCVDVPSIKLFCYCK